MRKWLSMNVIWRAAQFLDFQGSRRETELALHSMLLEEKALLYLCQPHKVHIRFNILFSYTTLHCTYIISFLTAVVEVSGEGNPDRSSISGTGKGQVYPTGCRARFV